MHSQVALVELLAIDVKHFGSTCTVQGSSPQQRRRRGKSGRDAAAQLGRYYLLPDSSRFGGKKVFGTSICRYCSSCKDPIYPRHLHRISIPQQTRSVPGVFADR